MKVRTSQPKSQTLADRVRLAPSRTRAAYLDRIATILRTLDAPVASRDVEVLVAALETRLADRHPAEMWLTLAVLRARLPEPAAVIRARRRAAFDGVGAALEQALVVDDSVTAAGETWPEVEVITGRVVVDVHQMLAPTAPDTADRRLTHEVTARWQRSRDPVFVTWAPDRPALTTVSLGSDRAPRTGLVTVPWQCVLLLPEPQLDRGRAEYLHAMLRFSGNRSGAIGFDCTPLSAVEDTTDEICSGFAAGLAALTHADRMVTVSASSAREYSGWKSMLAGTGLVGPVIDTVPLPLDSVGTVDDAARDSARLAIDVGGLPLVLVPTHLEPRMNHLGVLHSAELLWRAGLSFNLVFTGHDHAGSQPFHARVRALQEGGRAVHWVDGLSDAQRWAAYELAHCTVASARTDGASRFVAESLAQNIPVITSDIASMQEIAAGGGAIMIDPRRDSDLTGALRTLLTDPDTRAELVAQAERRPRRTWDDFADELWQALVDPSVA